MNDMRKNNEMISISEDLLKVVRKRALKRNISLEEFVQILLSKGLSLSDTEEYVRPGFTDAVKTGQSVWTGDE